MRAKIPNTRSLTANEARDRGLRADRLPASTAGEYTFRSLPWPISENTPSQRAREREQERHPAHDKGHGVAAE
jgi:hypothetical protein